MRKIEFTELVKLKGQVWEEGDIKSFPKAEADQYINLGWAKCCETGEQGDRVPGTAKIQVDDVITTIGN